MNIFVCVVFIGLLCVSGTLSTVIVTDANTSSTPTVSTISTASTTKGTVDRTQPSTKEAASVTVVKDDASKAEPGPTPSGAIKPDTSKPSDMTAANANVGGILGIIGSHDALNLAVADNPQNGLRNNRETTSEFAVKTAQTNNAKDGHSLGHANVGPKADSILSDTNIPTTDAVAAKPDKNSVVQDKPHNTVEVFSDLNKVDQKPGCNVKNSTCVPTREELIAAGVSNVDILQHRVSGPGVSMLKFNEPLNNKVIDANENKPDKNARCNVKNKTCVPTKDEIIAAGVTNVDLLQHRVTDFGPKPDLNKPLIDKVPETNVNNPDKKAGCNVKNGTCVPSESELIAAGVNLGEFVGQYSLDSVEPTVEVVSDLNRADQKPGCNVKNSTCVPTREELIAAGVSNVDILQHRVSGPGVSMLKFNDPLKNKVVDANENKPDKNAGCNVKNKTCVPTRDELIADGVTNVDLLQHRVTDFGPKPDLNKPLMDKVLETNVNNPDKKAGCNVKNGTCVPSESELIAAGVNLGEFVGQYSLDSENVFLGQFKQSDANIRASDIQTATVGSGNTDSNLSLKEDKRISNVSTLYTPADEVTKVLKQSTVHQIPAPSPTTVAKTTISDTFSTTDVVESKLESPTKQTSGKNKELISETTQRLTTSAAGSELTTSSQQTTSGIQGFQACPNIDCPGTCRYGRKVNSDGCETCECKFSDDCPRVLPASRLLCLLQVRTSQSCTSNTDCRRNRICCPGTCGPTCRRASRNRSMLLSMLVD